MITVTVAAAVAEQPDEGMGKLIGLGVAIAIAWLTITTKERYWPSPDSQDADPSPEEAAPTGRGKKQLSQKHASVDSVREQRKRAALSAGDSRAGDGDSGSQKGDSGSRKGRQSARSGGDSNGLSKWQMARNVMKYGQTTEPKPRKELPAADVAEDLDDDYEEEELLEDDTLDEERETPQLVAYRPDSAATGDVEEVVDLDLDDEDDEAEPERPLQTKEQLISFVHRTRFHEGMGRNEMYAEAMRLSGKGVSTIDRALRDAKGRHDRQWGCDAAEREAAA